MYYIMLLKSGAGISASYSFMTTVEAGTGATIRKSFPTLQDAQDYVQNMITSGDYSLNSFLVVRGVKVTSAITLEDET